MKPGSGPFEADFVTASGLSGYREAMMLATTWVGTELAEQSKPGLVDGYADLKQAVDAIPLHIPTGIGLPGALGEAINLLAQNSAVVTHPAYLAHLHCPPTVASLAAEVLTSAFNQSLDSFDQAPAATAVEQRVIEYLCATMGYDRAADGTFTSGGTQSNLEALLIARDLFARRTLGWDITVRGLPPEAASWRVLCTRQTHFSVRQALRILGLAGAPLEIPTDSAGRLNIGALVDELAKATRTDTPIMALVLTAGTTDYGAIDPLREAITVARERDIWTHVDACAGGCLAFSDTHRHLLDGIELADSIAIDFHKLMFQVISCSALLVRQRRDFDVLIAHADYLNPEQDSHHDVVNLVGKSIQTTRRFDALKVWVTLRALGQRRIADMIDVTCAAAAAAAEATDHHPSLTLLAPAATNTVVLRWQHPGLSNAECDDLNNAIRAKLAHSGHALVGRSKVMGRQAIKLTFVNPLVTAELAAGTVAEIAEQGEQILRTRGREFTTA